MVKFTSSKQPVERKLKMLIFGAAGTGKTWFALHAPRALVLDTESSTDAYRGRADFPEFWVANTAEPADVLSVLEQLRSGKSEAAKVKPETLVVDSFTVLWQVRIEAGDKHAAAKALQRNRSAETAKSTFYDWAWIKRPIKQIFTQLINMPVSVVITAREKAVYTEKPDGSMEITDYVPDIERSASYVFDLVLRIVVHNGKRYAKVIKSRFPEMPPGTVIEDPTWDKFAPLARSGSAQSVTPDPVAAAEREAQVNAKDDQATSARKPAKSTKSANAKRKRQPAQKQQKPDAGAFDFGAWLDRALDHAEQHGVTLARLAVLFGEPFPTVAKRLVTAGKTDAEMTTWFAELVDAVVNRRPVARNGHVYDEDEQLFLDYYAANWWPFAEQWNMHPDAEEVESTFSELAEAVPDWNKAWFVALGKMGWNGAKDWDAVHALFDAEHFSGTDTDAYAVWHACVARTPALADALRKDKMNQTAQEQRAKETTKPTRRKKLA